MSRRSQRVLVALSTAAVGSGLLAACVAANEPVAQPNPTLRRDVSATPGMSGMGSAAGNAMPAMSMAPSHSEGNAPAAPAGPNAGGIFSFTFPATVLRIVVAASLRYPPAASGGSASGG